MKSSDLQNAIAICMAARLPICIEAEPGCGKSSVARYTNDRVNLGRRMSGLQPRVVYDVRAGTQDIGDAKGLPNFTEDGRTTWSTPWFYQDLPSFYLLDDFTQANPTVMNTYSEPLLEYTVNGQFKLHPESVFVLTGNRREDKSNVHEMPRMIANRVCFVAMTTDVEEMISANRRANKPLEPLVLPEVKHDPDICEELEAFLKRFPAMLANFDPKAKQFASPRSIMSLNRVLPYLRHFPNIQLPMMQGIVGEAFAAEFNGFLRLRNRMPNPDHIIADPLNAPMPGQDHEDLSIWYALMTGLARRVIDKHTSERVFTYLSRPECLQEYGMVCATSIMKANIGLLQSPAGMKWCASNAKHLIGIMA